MSSDQVTRVLVLVERSAITTDLLNVVRERAERGPAQFRVVGPNPANAEVHLLHPERHEKAAEAEHALRDAIPVIEAVAGAPVIGSVSVRHDPMDVVEDVLFNEPVDEIILAIHTHHLAQRLHQDLPHRLAHYGIPITTVKAGQQA